MLVCKFVFAWCSFCWNLFRFNPDLVAEVLKESEMRLLLALNAFQKFQNAPSINEVTSCTIIMCPFILLSTELDRDKVFFLHF